MLVRFARHPATWLYAAIWITAAAVLVVSGHQDRVVGALLILAFVLMFSYLTLALTPASPARDPGTTARWRLYTQTSVLVVLFALVGLTVMSMNHIGPPQVARMAILDAVFSSLKTNWHFSSVPLSYTLADPVVGVVVPLVLLVALGARRRELGLQRGYHSGRVVLAWALPLVVGIAIGLVQEPSLVVRTVIRFGRNFFENGFTEEFGFRGGLQSRLERIAGPGWGLVLASLLFGVWHVGVNAPEVGRSIPLGLCVGVVDQSTIGLGLGVVFLRTRSLVAGTVVHMLFDTVGL